METGIMRLLREVLSDVRPDEKKVMKEVGATLKRINSALKRRKIRAKASTGGSIAKGTHLKGDYDCDIFVKFDLKKYGEQDISKILGDVLKKAFKRVEKVHGSRDYYHIENSLMYEIVPVLDIKKTSEAVNVTDCSPLHVVWVNKFPRMKGDIRLTESYIKGFSGHVVDILTIYYGGFLKLLKASQRWKHKEVIDYYNKHKGKAMLNLNRSKTESALIVIDPIQPDRNAAAALSSEKFELFTKKAAEFLKKPAKSFFIREKVSIGSLEEKAKSKDGRLILIDVEAKRGKEDVIGAKLLKALEYIVSQMKANEFKVIDYGWDWPDEKSALFWLIVDKEDLPGIRICAGPPVKVKKHYDNFRKMHKKVFEHDDKVFAEEKREFVRPEGFVKKMLDDEYVKSRVKKISMKDHVGNRKAGVIR
jgi:tRNA nucleotidyltransferase (CCA-adding enzyme)